MLLFTALMQLQMRPLHATVKSLKHSIVAAMPHFAAGLLIMKRTLTALGQLR
jgi:hypothetical protein